MYGYRSLFEKGEDDGKKMDPCPRIQPLLWRSEDFSVRYFMVWPASSIQSMVEQSASSIQSMVERPLASAIQTIAEQTGPLHVNVFCYSVVPCRQPVRSCELMALTTPSEVEAS